MLEWFKCPDGDITPVKDCLQQCRMGNRCLTLPTLHRIAKEREWNGVASTTQLLNGTMNAFLKLTQPYAIDPDSMIFAIHGENVHKVLEDEANKLGLPAEIALNLDRDIFDLLEPSGDGQSWTLTDYKAWGSYRVMKVLGIVESGKKPNPNGEVYQKSGKWGAAGSPKMVTVFKQFPQQADNFDAELQLNRYRVILEERGIKVSKMLIQVLVRDGSLAIARSRGIERNSYLIPVKLLDDAYVRDYFKTKDNNLHQALDSGSWSQPCDNRECWDGVRCRNYCEVWQYCTKGLLEHKE